jgi:hypothetical protein
MERTKTTKLKHKKERKKEEKMGIREMRKYIKDNNEEKGVKNKTFACTGIASRCVDRPN